MASVTPQNWLFLDEYRALREGLLTSASLSIVVGLGPRAFETITGEVVNATLVVLENKTPESITVFAGIDANAADGPVGKSDALRTYEIRILPQAEQRRNPDARITTQAFATVEHLLSEFSYGYQGLSTGDNPRFRRNQWELPFLAPRWFWLAVIPCWGSRPHAPSEEPASRGSVETMRLCRTTPVMALRFDGVLAYATVAGCTVPDPDADDFGDL